MGECAPARGGTIGNALRAALRINSGKIIYNFGIAERLRALRYPIFTGGGRGGKRHLQCRFLRKRGAAGKALLGASGLNPLRHGLRRATSPERGRFCSTYRKVPKSSPFGGAGRDRRERTERGCSRGYPLSLCCAKPAPPRGSLWVLPQSFPLPLKPSPWGRWLDAKRQDGRGHSLVTLPYKRAKRPPENVNIG